MQFGGIKTVVPNFFRWIFKFFSHAEGHLNATIIVLINPLYTGNSYTDTLTNSREPDEMLQNVVSLLGMMSGLPVRLTFDKFHIIYLEL